MSNYKKEYNGTVTNSYPCYEKGFLNYGCNSQFQKIVMSKPVSIIPMEYTLFRPYKMPNLTNYLNNTNDNCSSYKTLFNMKCG